MENSTDKTPILTAAEKAKLISQLIDIRRDAGMTRIYTAFSLPDKKSHTIKNADK